MGNENSQIMQLTHKLTKESRPQQGKHKRIYEVLFRAYILLEQAEN